MMMVRKAALFLVAIVSLGLLSPAGALARGGGGFYDGGWRGAGGPPVWRSGYGAFGAGGRGSPYGVCRVIRVRVGTSYGWRQR
jgi:hypothetical protein